MNKGIEELHDSKTLQEEAAKLKQDKLPQRDLWQGIERAIVHSQPSHRDMQNTEATEFTSKAKKLWRYPIAIAASLVVAVVVAYGSFSAGQNSQGLALVEQLSEQHAAQKKGLLVSLQDLPTNTTNWKEQLESLAEAEAAIKAALQESPNNPALLGMLKNVYEQELAIIERVHAPKWQAT